MSAILNSIIRSFVDFTLFAFSALLVENAVLSRGFDAPRIIQMSEDMDSLLRFSFILTFITTLTCCATFGVDGLLIRMNLPGSIKPVGYVLFMGIVFVIIHFLLKFRMADYNKIESNMALAMFNCAVLGSMLLVSQQELTFAQRFGFGFGTGLGYTVAILLVMEGNRKMQNKVVPIAFKGLPAMLIYIGILSMAIYGLAGYQV